MSYEACALVWSVAGSALKHSFANRFVASLLQPCRVLDAHLSSVEICAQVGSWDCDLRYWDIPGMKASLSHGHPV